MSTSTSAVQNSNELETMRAQFMAAINFAITQGIGAEDFLRSWIEGDVSDWPDFKGPVPW